MNKESLYQTLQIILAISLITFMLARIRGFPTYFFWPIFLCLVTVSFFNIIMFRNKIKILSLVVYVITISLLPILALPHTYQMTSDDIFEAQMADTIVHNKFLDPADGNGFSENYYGYNPILHLTVAFASILTGVKSHTIVKYALPILLKLFLVLIVLLIVKQFTRSKFAYLTAFIFSGAAGIMFVSISRRSIAGIFLILAVYSLIKSKQKSWNLLFYIFSTFIILADRSVSMYFLVFMIGAWIFSGIKMFKNKLIFPNLFAKTTYFMIFYVIWKIALRSIFIDSDSSYVNAIGKLIAGLFGGQTGTSISGIYFGYEKLLIYLSQAMFFIVGGIGFIIYLYRKFKHKDFGNNFFVYLGLYCFGFFAITPLLMMTEYDTAFTIMLWFFCIPISIFFTYIIHKLTSKYVWISLILILLLFSGSILMGTYTPRLINRGPDDDIVLGSDIRSKSLGLYQSGKWLSGLNPDAHVIGDSDVYELYGGFTKIRVNSYPENVKLIYSGEGLGLFEEKLDFDFGSYSHTLKKRPADYLIFNYALAKYPNPYISKDLVITNSRKMDESELADKIYQNGEISIYHINRLEGEGT